MANLPNGGKKSDYVERLKRQRTTSAVKFYLIAIILGGLIGLAYIKRAEIKSAYESLVNSPPPAPPAEPAKVPEPPKVVDAPPPVDSKKITQPTVTVPPKPPEVIQQPAISAKDEVTARKLIADGKVLLEKFDFAGASKSFEDAAKLKIGAPLKSEASTWVAKAGAFQNATRHIPIADYAQSESAVIVEHNDGTEWRGVKVKEDDNVVSINVLVDEARPAAEGKARLDIPKTEVKRVVSLPLSKRRADFAELVLATESGTTITHSTDYYDLVYLSKRLGLGAECVKYLGRAFDGGPGHAADPELGDSYRMVVVRRVISRVTLLVASGRIPQAELELKKLLEMLPGFPPAELAVAEVRSQLIAKVRPGLASRLIIKDPRNESSPKPRKPSSDPSEKTKPTERDLGPSVVFDPVKGTGAAAQVVDRANAKFEEGMQIIRKYQIGVGGNKIENNRILTQAKALLMQAIDTYEEALKLEPGNRAIESAQQSANQMVYFCNKNMILG